MLRKIISGGQTGADQGGLIAAFKESVPTGGTAPDGFQTAKGPNPLLQLLNLKASGDLRSRTIRNIADSDGTVLISWKLSSPGSVLTVNQCRRANKPVLVIDVSEHLKNSTGGTVWSGLVDKSARELATFVVASKIGVLNVAGNRESFDDLRMTTVAEGIVGTAIQLLRLADQLADPMT
jgi:hypothetical protein